MINLSDSTFAYLDGSHDEPGSPNGAVKWLRDVWKKQTGKVWNDRTIYQRPESGHSEVRQEKTVCGMSRMRKKLKAGRLNHSL